MRLEFHFREHNNNDVILTFSKNDYNLGSFSALRSRYFLPEIPSPMEMSQFA